jgi:hypothetical protein
MNKLDQNAFIGCFFMINCTTHSLVFLFSKLDLLDALTDTGSR